MRHRKRPHPGETETARWVMTTFIRRDDLRRRHPQALRDGPDGGFCGELCAMLGEGSAAAEDVRAVFARGLEKRPRQRYDVFLEYRQACPLGLTPAGRGQLLIFLLAKAGSISPFPTRKSSGSICTTRKTRTAAWSIRIC